MPAFRSWVIHGRVAYHAKVVDGYDPPKPSLTVQLPGRQVVVVSRDRIYGSRDEAEKVLALEEEERLRYIP